MWNEEEFALGLKKKGPGGGARPASTARGGPGGGAMNALGGLAAAARAREEKKKEADAALPEQSTLDPSRAQNMNIMLAQFGKKEFSEIAEAISNLDEHFIGLAGISSILDFLPEMDELKNIKDYVDSGKDVALLGKAEK